MLRILRFGLLIVGLLGSTASTRADFKSNLAAQFNADARYFILNLPPRPGGWPGSVYTPDMRFTVLRGIVDDPNIERGPLFDLAATISLELSGKAEAGIGRLSGLSATASNTAAAAVTFKQARIYDLTLQQIRDRINTLPADQRRSPGPVVVYRAYEGIPAIVLTRRQGASSEAWATLKKGLVEAGFGVGGEAGDNVTIQSKDRIIFAFEVAQIADVAVLSSLSDASTGRISASVAATTTEMLEAGSLTGEDSRNFNSCMSKITKQLAEADKIQPQANMEKSLNAARDLCWVRGRTLILGVGAHRAPLGFRRLEAESFEKANPVPSVR